MHLVHSKLEVLHFASGLQQDGHNSGSWGACCSGMASRTAVQVSRPRTERMQQEITNKALRLGADPL